MSAVQEFILISIGLFVGFIGIILDIIGSWKLFKKAGQPGWKALIPFYNTYLNYKISWHGSMYWFGIGIMVLNLVFAHFVSSNAIYVVGSLLLLAVLGIHIEQKYRMAVCFGKGVLFTIGIVLFEPIFYLILGCGKSTYKYVDIENTLVRELKENLVHQNEKYKEKLEELRQEREAAKAKGTPKKFAEGFCFKKVVIFFVIGCILGTYWEEALYFFTHNFKITDRQGLLYGPFSPIYGFGIAIFVLILGKHNEKRTILKTYLYSCLIGGVVEYMTSLIAEKLFNVTFWDYHGMFLNINGRTTVPFMLFWGLGGLVLMKVGYPLISKGLEKIPVKAGNIVFNIFFVLFMIDIILTYSAFARMDFRDKGDKPLTFYGEFLDKAYPDDYMAKKFPVMTTDK